MVSLENGFEVRYLSDSTSVCILELPNKLKITGRVATTKIVI